MHTAPAGGEGEDTPVSAGREKAPSKRMVLLALFAVEMADDLAADFIQGELLLNRADVVGDHRHPINHAAILVLPDRVSAGLAHFKQALGAVRAHAGEDNAEGIPARVLGNRIEQHVNRRAEPADLGSAFALDVIAAGILGDPELDRKSVV